MRTREPLLELAGFCSVSRDEAKLLLRNTELVRLPTGQSVLLRSGPAEELLVVVQGALQALGPLTWTAGPGDVLGAHAVLKRTSQQAGFRANEPCLVAYAGIQQTRTLLAGSPAFATAVAVALSAELDRSLEMRASQ